MHVYFVACLNTASANRRSSFIATLNSPDMSFYGFFSNVARGKRKKADTDDNINCFFEPELTDKTI